MRGFAGKFGARQFWDITKAYPTASFSITAQDTLPRGISFKADGSKLYICGDANNRIFQYSLSTAWDISTTSYDSVSFSFAAQTTDPLDVKFNDNGTKMYVFSSDVYQYSLTAWDVSTAVYESTFNPAEDTLAFSGNFKSDGTKFYIAGSANDTIFQYSLSTAWDLSTATYDSLSKDVSTKTNQLRSLVFKSDGTRLYFVNASTNEVFQYTLSTAWNISTAAFQSITVSSNQGGGQGLALKSDGSKMYLVGGVNLDIYQYSL